MAISTPGGQPSSIPVCTGDTQGVPDPSCEVPDVCTTPTPSEVGLADVEFTSEDNPVVLLGSVDIFASRRSTEGVGKDVFPNSSEMQTAPRLSLVSSFASRRGSINVGVLPPGQVMTTMTTFERFIAGETPASARWLGFCCSCCFIFLLFVMGGAMAKLDASFGWFVIGESLTQAFFAHEKVREGTYFAEEQQDSSLEIYIAQKRTMPTPQAEFIYEAGGNHCPSKFTRQECDLKKGNLITVATIEKIRKFEEELWRDSKYLKKYCAIFHANYSQCVPPRSLLQDLYWDPTGVNTWKEAHTMLPESAWCYADEDSGANLAPEEQWKLRFQSLCDDSIPAMVSMREALLPNFVCDGDGDETYLIKHGTPFLRSIFFFGFPLEKERYHDEAADWWNDETKYLQEQFAKDYSTIWKGAAEQFNSNIDTLRVMMGPRTFIFEQEKTDSLYADMYFVFLSFVFVFLFMWFNVESLFIAWMGMVQILGSVFPSIIIWTIFNPKGFQFMQFLAVFMILGIGADDVFVLNDAWHQAKAELATQGINAGTAHIFVLAYRRAYFAMCATTATTSLAFLFGMMNAVPAISDFCVFAFIIVICDFLFCITIFAASVAFHDRFMQGKRCLCCGGSAPEGACCQPGCCFGGARKLWRMIAKQSDGESRFLENLFNGPLFDCINCCKYPLIIFWAVLVLLAIIGCILGVKPQEMRTAAYVDPYHPFQRVQDIQDEYFASSDKQRLTVTFGFADQPIEKWDASSNSAFPNAEKLSFADISNAVSKTGQQKILEFCTNADKYRCLSPSHCIVSGVKATCETHKVGNVKILKDSGCQTGVYCLMEQVRDYAEHRGETFPVDDLSATLKAQEFKDYLNEYFKRSAHWVRMQYQEGTGVVFDGDGAKIKYMWVNFNATYNGFYLPYAAGKKIKERWTEYTRKYLGGTSHHFTSLMLTFTVLQEVLIIESFKGVGVSSIVTLCTLALVTLNWYLAILGTASILLIMVGFLGLWPILGWEIDIFSSVILTMAIGLAVDYTVHILHAFNECSIEDRTERVRFALGHMGITVLSGALTTLMAALPLLCAQSQFFFMFGTFVFIIISLSIIIVIFLVVPCLLVLGPTGNFGDITCLYTLAERIVEKCLGSKATRTATS